MKLRVDLNTTCFLWKEKSHIFPGYSSLRWCCGIFCIVCVKRAGGVTTCEVGKAETPPSAVHLW